MTNSESMIMPGPEGEGRKGPPESGEGRQNNKDIQNSFTKIKTLWNNEKM